MPTLRIPDKIRPGVAALRKLDRSKVEELVAALKSAPSPRVRDLSTWLGRNAPSIPKVDINSIAEALISLYSRLETTDDSVPAFAAAIRDAVARAAPPDSSSTEFESRLFEENLKQLLDIQRFASLVKARALKFENERDFCSARVLTDVRPVFPRDVTAGPVAMLIQHHLKIAFHEGSQELRNFYVTLSDEDLADLRRVLDRAEAKSRSLRGALSHGLALGGADPNE